MSGCGQAASAAARPSGVVMSAATNRIAVPWGLTFPSSAAVASSASRPRATIVTCTPSFASASAQPRPRPLLAAHTSACFPAMPRSIVVSL
jgi:hypothetical protein